MSEKISEAKVSVIDLANDRDEIRELLARIAGEGGSKPERIARAARRLGWGFARAKAHWYGEARRIDIHEMRAAREAAARAEEAIIHADLQKLNSRIAVLEARIRSLTDEDSPRA